MAKAPRSEDDYKVPVPRVYTTDRVRMYSTADEIRFLLEGMASGEEMVSDSLRKFAIERLADSVGLTSGSELPKGEPPNPEDHDKPDVTKMSDAELTAWLRQQHAARGGC